jgi:hypothetical protein
MNTPTPLLLAASAGDPIVDAFTFADLEGTGYLTHQGVSSCLGPPLLAWDLAGLGVGGGAGRGGGGDDVHG